jgi:subtilisin family serine protease
MRFWRLPIAATAAAAVMTAVTSPSLAAVDCVARPASPAGYEIAAVKAGDVAVPQTTRPIAVLDSGVAAVPELQGRLRAGYNVINGSQNTNDIDGHGTAVASVAAAAAGGVRGVSPTSPIVPIKIFDDAGNSTPEGFIAGIDRAVSADAAVINVSASAAASDIDAATAKEVKDAIYAAVSLGIPVVAATGNEGAGALGAPAAYPHVIAVGATDASGSPAPFSNTGSGLDLVAPGAGLVTAAPGVLCSSGYGTVTGTSFAAPAVAGAVALLLAEHPDLDVAQLTDMLRLHGSARAWSPVLGFGMLDVAAALAAPVPSADQPEVNDDISWAKEQTPVLAAPKHSKTLAARIAPHMDPADVYRVRLKKGDRLRVVLRQAAGTKLRLSFGAKQLGPKPGAGFTQRIKSTGTYYVGVTIRQSPAAGTDYKLSLKR